MTSFVERPGIRSEIEGVTLWVSEVVYTPVQVYLTVDYTVPQALMDAYVEAQGGQPREMAAIYAHVPGALDEQFVFSGRRRELYVYALLHRPVL